MPLRLVYVLLCCKSVPAEDFIKEVFHVIKRLLEPCADSVCRGASLAAIGAGIPLEVMAGCRDDLSLFYSLAANCAHLVAGVTVFGAGRGLCADEFGDVFVRVLLFAEDKVLFIPIYILASNSFFIRKTVVTDIYIYVFR